MAASGKGPVPEHATASAICALLENPTSTVLTSGFVRAKRDGGLGQGLQPVVLEKSHLVGPGHVELVVGSLGKRLAAGTAARLRRRAEDPGGQHPDHHDPHAPGRGPVDDAPIVQGAEALGHGLPRAGVEQVVVGLEGIELAAVHQRVDGLDVAQAGEPEKAHAALVAEPLEPLDDAPRPQHLVRGHAEAPGFPPLDEPRVELHQVHRVAAQAREPLLRVGYGRRRDVPERIGFEADLGGKDDLLSRPRPGRGRGGSPTSLLRRLWRCQNS